MKKVMIVVLLIAASTAFGFYGPDCPTILDTDEEVPKMVVSE